MQKFNIREIWQLFVEHTATFIDIGPTKACVYVHLKECPLVSFRVKHAEWRMDLSLYRPLILPYNDCIIHITIKRFGVSVSVNWWKEIAEVQPRVEWYPAGQNCCCLRAACFSLCILISSVLPQVSGADLLTCCSWHEEVYKETGSSVMLRIHVVWTPTRGSVKWEPKEWVSMCES